MKQILNCFTLYEIWLLMDLGGQQEKDHFAMNL